MPKGQYKVICKGLRRQEFTIPSYKFEDIVNIMPYAYDDVVAIRRCSYYYIYDGDTLIESKEHYHRRFDGQYRYCLTRQEQGCPICKTELDKKSRTVSGKFGWYLYSWYECKNGHKLLTNDLDKENYDNYEQTTSKAFGRHPAGSPEHKHHKRVI